MRCDVCVGDGAVIRHRERTAAIRPAHSRAAQVCCDIPSTTLENRSHYGDNEDAYQHELRISGTAMDMWDWTVGAYYQEAASQTNVITQANRPENGGVFDILIDIPLSSETKAVFTHNEFALTEDTDLTVGVRYNEFDQEDGTILTGNFNLGTAMLPGGEVPPVDTMMGKRSTCSFDVRSDINLPSQWTTS